MKSYTVGATSSRTRTRILAAETEQQVFVTWATHCWILESEGGIQKLYLCLTLLLCPLCCYWLDCPSTQEPVLPSQTGQGYP